MTPLVSEANWTLSLLTVAGDAVVILLAVGFLLKYFAKNSSWIDAVADKGLWLAFATALVSVIVSLFYSNVVGYEPCTLCWWQRIFMYPQVILLGMAFVKKDRLVADYCLALSAIGAAIAGYQVLLQFGIASVAPCSAAAVSCTKIYFENFGYVTIPVMAFTAFLLNIEFLAAAKMGKVS